MSEDAPQLDLRVTLYPEPVLRRRAEPYEAFDEALAALVQSMFERMYASKGVGLAAPQVGVGKRLLVANHTGESEDELVLVNPTLKETFGTKTTFEEGCLSFPGIYAEVVRPESCTVEAFDVEGNAKTYTFHGFQSRVIQHEYDHLEGVLLVDRMSPADKQRHKGALGELVEAYRRARARA
ncbi:MAG TPA: peptide deformylase [Planctomycetes bacterium]|nr:peptide deformylase [Planctomycetota bacterium]